MPLKRWCNTCKSPKEFYKPGYLTLKSNVRKCNDCDIKFNIKNYPNKISL